jgi:hypothetical protein
MTLKYTFVFIFLIFTYSMLHAQVDSMYTATPIARVPMEKGLGVNLSKLFQKLARFDADSSFNNPYLFVGNLRRKNRGVSVAIGGSYGQSLDQEEGFVDFRKTSDVNLASRVSFDFYRPLGSRWLSVLSIDGIFGLNSRTEVNETGIDLVNTSEKTTTYGIGPRLQIRFACTKHLALGVESYVHLRYQERNSSRTFRNFPGLNDDNDQVKFINTQTVLPLALFVYLQL